MDENQNETPEQKSSLRMALIKIAVGMIAGAVAGKCTDKALDALAARRNKTEETETE